MRFGLEMASDHTLEEVGNPIRMSRVNAFVKIEAKAMKKLRHPFPSRTVEELTRK